MTFKFGTDSGNVAQYEVRASVDNYADDGMTGVANGGGCVPQNKTITFPATTGWSTNSSAITFRFYPANPCTGCTEDFDDITVKGNVISACTPPTAAVSLTGSSTICSGQTTTVQALLTGTGPWTLTWLDGAGGTNFTQTSSSSTASRTVTPASTTTYTVTAITDSTGCAGGTSSGSAAVTVNPLPSSSITTPSSVCASSTGNTASVSSAAGATYAWTIAGGTITAGSTSNVVTFTAGTGASLTQSVTVASSTGCTNSASTNILIVASVAIQTQPSDTTVCSGSNATFTVAATGVTAYQWLKGVTTLSNVGTVSGATSATLLLTGVGTGDSGAQFTCQLTGCGAVTTNTSAATLTVNASNPVSVSIAASPGTTNCVNTSVTFTATPTNGGASPAYQWKKNGNNVGSNSPTYIDSSLTNNDVISCVLTSNVSCRVSRYSRRRSAVY